jgi:hypothetical protein
LPPLSRFQKSRAWVEVPPTATKAANGLEDCSAIVQPQVANRAFYAAIGICLDGWLRRVGHLGGSPASEGANYWLSVLTDLKNWGVADVSFLIYDGPKDLLYVVETVWPLPIMQTCVIHLMRNTFKYASKKDWDALRRDAKAHLMNHVSGNHKLVIQNVETFHSLLGLRRGNPYGHLLDQRDSRV